MRKLDLWQKLEYTAMRPGLERIKAFLKEAGNPEKSYKIVHVAGTNGKGSTAAMIAKVLEASGYRTGLYISPHLVSMTERISVNSKEISAKVLHGMSRKYFSLAKKHSLTFFEFITAIAYIYFKEQKIDAAVLETGLGGRFDATNVIERPAVTVITSIDYDHTEILGRTISRIATEKAGIIKCGSPCVCGAENKSALKVIERKAEDSSSDIWEVNRDFKAEPLATDWKRVNQSIVYKDKYGSLKIDLPLLGNYQIRNAGVAVAALRALGRSGLKISEKAIKKGIKAVKWQGRFDVRKISSGAEAKTVILDGAHNPEGIRSFMSSFKKSAWAKKPFDIIFGVLKDKDYRNIVKEISNSGAERIFIVPVKSSRALGISDIKRQFGVFQSESRVVALPSLGVALKQLGQTAVVAGSLYLVGEAMKIINHKGEKND